MQRSNWLRTRTNMSRGDCRADRAGSEPVRASARNAGMTSMRTTIVLESDLVERVKATARAKNRSFKATLNSVLRAVLAAELGGGSRYRTRSWPMGLRPSVDLTHALKMAA